MATRLEPAEVRLPKHLLYTLGFLFYAFYLIYSAFYSYILMSMIDNELQSENGSTGLPDCGDAIDPLTFEQILEMDDDEEEREFSKSIVYGFFDQAEVTFKDMDSCV